MLELGELSNDLIYPSILYMDILRPRKGDVTCQKSHDKISAKEVHNQNSNLESLHWWWHAIGLTCQEMGKVDDADTLWYRAHTFTQREAERSGKRHLKNRQVEKWASIQQAPSEVTLSQLSIVSLLVVLRTQWGKDHDSPWKKTWSSEEFESFPESEPGVEQRSVRHRNPMFFLLT